MSNDTDDFDSDTPEPKPQIIGVSDDYGRDGTPEQEHNTTMSRVRISAYGAFEALKDSFEALVKNAKNAAHRDQLSTVQDLVLAARNMLEKIEPVSSEDQWQAGGPVAWVAKPRHRGDIAYLCVHGVPAKGAYLNHRLHGREAELKFQQQIERLVKTAREINKAAAEGRALSGFRY